MPYSWPLPSSRKNSPACVPPVTSINSWTPASTSASTAYVTIGRSYSGSRCLFVMRVSGASRLPAPPASITPFIGAMLAAALSHVVLFCVAALAVVVDHHPHELGEADGRLPAELLTRLRGVTEEEV